MYLRRSHRTIVWPRLAFVFALAIGMSVTAEARSAGRIDAFIGHWQGLGITQDQGKAKFSGLINRDLDVRIEREGNGFKVNWTTVHVKQAMSDQHYVSRKSAWISFVPTERDTVFQMKAAADPIDGQPYSWARFSGKSLLLYWMVIADDGSYELQSYERTLLGDGEMVLKFLRVRDGKRVRTVIGRLGRVK